MSIILTEPTTILSRRATMDASDEALFEMELGAPLTPTPQSESPSPQIPDPVITGGFLWWHHKYHSNAPVTCPPRQRQDPRIPDAYPSQALLLHHRKLDNARHERRLYGPAIPAVEQGRSHESECSSFKATESITISSGEKQDNIEAMALRAVESLNPTFLELKSKNEETRLRASYELRNQVIVAARGETFDYLRYT